MGKRTNTAVWIESKAYWKISVQKDGIRKSFYSSKLGRAGQREANAKADAWLDDGIQMQNRPLSAYYVGFLDDLKARTSESNWSGIDSRWKKWVNPVIGHVKPAALNDQLLQNAINRGYQHDLSKKYLKSIRADMISLCKYLRKIKVSTYHPEEVIIPKEAHVGVRRILQPDDIITLFSVDTTKGHGKVVRDKYINAYRFQVLTGLRPGELKGLMRSDVVGDQVRVQRSINVKGKLTTGKNQNAIRSFTMSITAKNVMDEQLEQMDGIYIFGIVSSDSYRNRWISYCKANGIPYVSPYEMRHTFVSVIQSLPEGWVKDLVGHSKNMDTFGTYGHSVVGMDSRIAASVEGVFRDILMGSK